MLLWHWQGSILKYKTMKNPLYSEIRGQVLTWIGIIGAAVTILSAVSPLVTLSYWAKIIVELWDDIVNRFWSRIFSFLDITMDPAIYYYLSATLFIFSMFFGSKISERFSDEPSHDHPAEMDEYLVYLTSLLFSISFIPYVTNQMNIPNNFLIVGTILCLSFIGHAFTMVAEDLFFWIYESLKKKRGAIITTLILLAFGFHLSLILFALISIFAMFVSIFVCLKYARSTHIKKRVLFPLGLLVSILTLNYTHIYLVELELFLSKEGR